jgi:hypothetical protein
MRDHKEELKKELAEIAPLLGKLKERPSGYRVPEGYFEALREKVLSTIPAEIPLEARAGTRGAALRKFLTPRFVLAYAAVLAFVLGGWYVFSRREQATQCAELSCLSSEELNAFIESHIEQFDTGTILEVGDGASFGTGFEVSAVDVEESSEVLLRAVEALSEEEIEALMD